MSTTSTERVCRRTGIADLDALLDDATPETVTAAFVCMRLPFISNEVGDQVMAALSDRVAEYRAGQFPDCDPLAEIAPVHLWLDLLDRVEEQFEQQCWDIGEGYTESKMSRGMTDHREAVANPARRREAVRAALQRAHADRNHPSHR